MAFFNEGEEDFNVPSDKELERLMRKANKKASKENSFKRTTQQQYISQINKIIKEIFEENEDNPHLLLKCLALRCLDELSDLHCQIAEEQMNKRQYNCASNWMSDQGKIAAALELLQSVRIGEDDWMA